MANEENFSQLQASADQAAIRAGNGEGVDTTNNFGDGTLAENGEQRGHNWKAMAINLLKLVSIGGSAFGLLHITDIMAYASSLNGSPRSNSILDCVPSAPDSGVTTSEAVAQLTYDRNLICSKITADGFNPASFAINPLTATGKDNRPVIPAFQVTDLSSSGKAPEFFILTGDRSAGTRDMIRVPMISAEYTPRLVMDGNQLQFVILSTKVNGVRADREVASAETHWSPAAIMRPPPGATYSQLEFDFQPNQTTNIIVNFFNDSQERIASLQTAEGRVIELVGPGVDRNNLADWLKFFQVRSAMEKPSADRVGQVYIFDSQGKFQNFSVPEGMNNFGYTEATNTWTGVTRDGIAAKLDIASGKWVNVQTLAPIQY